MLGTYHDGGKNRGFVLLRWRIKTKISTRQQQYKRRVLIATRRSDESRRPRSEWLKLSRCSFALYDSPAPPETQTHHSRIKSRAHIPANHPFPFRIDSPPRPPDAAKHSKMPPFISSLTLRTLRTLVQRPAITPLKPATATPRFFQSQSRFQPVLRTPTAAAAAASAQAGGVFRRQFSTTPARKATYNQVRSGCRVSQRARRSRSPALVDRSQMKGVCLKTGITKPKKPNSGERKTARVRLSSGKVITAYIPGEGMFWLLFPGGLERKRVVEYVRSRC